ncbi:Phosphoserine phosphatase [Methanothermobacter wolfeii]|nr:Phosphoserine phosphatase [Methanothermobacter wolfeii]
MVIFLIKLVVFDLDNVIIDAEAIDEIGKLAGVEEEVMEITEKAMQGDIDFETSIKERVQLLKGTSVEEIKSVAEKLPLMEGAEETIKALKEKGYRVAVISGSFDLVAEPLKDKLGLDYLFCNRLHEEDGVLTGEVSGPLVENSKYDVLCSILEEEGITHKECVAVGDGANDISMIEAVRLGIAFNAKPALKKKADAVVEKKDLREILPIIEKAVESDDKLKELSYDEVMDLKNEYEEKLSSIASERDELNEKAREMKERRDELNSKLRETLNMAVELRDKRNEINAQVEENKKLRDQINQEIRKLEWSSGGRDRIKIENEIKRIDKIIETRVLDINKENELVKTANELRKKLMKIQEDQEVREKAMELKKKSEEYHEKVVSLSEEAQEYHEKMLEYFKKTDEIRKEADEAHEKFLEFRRMASEKHEEFKSTLGEIKQINERINALRSRSRNVKRRADREKNLEEKEKAKEIYEKFKEGKKLSKEELLLLQKHRIV